MSTTDEQGRVHIEDDEARGAQTTGHLRWILGIGLVGAIIAMTLVWVLPALYGG